MGSRVQSTASCFPELCFLQFSVAKVLVGLRKQFIKNFIFPNLAWLLVLIIRIIMIIEISALTKICMSKTTPNCMSIKNPVLNWHALAGTGQLLRVKCADITKSMDDGSAVIYIYICILYILHTSCYVKNMGIECSVFRRPQHFRCTMGFVDSQIPIRNLAGRFLSCHHHRFTSANLEMIGSPSLCVFSGHMYSATMSWRQWT